MTPGFSGEESGLPTDKAAAEAREKQELAENGTQNDTQQAKDGAEAETESSREPDSEENLEEQNTESTEVPQETEQTTETESVPDKTADGGENAKYGAEENGGAGIAGNESDNGGNAVGSWFGRLFIRILLLAAAAAGFVAIFSSLVQFVKKRIQIYHLYVDFEIRRKHYRGAVKCVNRRIYRKLRRRMHMRNRSITDHEYEQLLYRAFSQIPPEKWGRYMEIVKKAAFSGEGPEEAEAVFCREIYYDLLDEK
jgi:hypothetical protein